MPDNKIQRRLVAGLRNIAVNKEFGMFSVFIGMVFTIINQCFANGKLDLFIFTFNTYTDIRLHINISFICAIDSHYKPAGLTIMFV